LLIYCPIFLIPIDCAAKEDSYDPGKESTVRFLVTTETGEVISNIGMEGVLGHSMIDINRPLEAFKIGSWWDVYCTRNRLYYEAQVSDLSSLRIEYILMNNINIIVVICSYLKSR
jgi:hypothetical protein